MNAHDDIYLDYAAATPVDERVLDAMLPYLTGEFYNPSAPYAHAREVAARVQEGREEIARCIGAHASNVTFTAGATEANNIAFAAVSGHVVVEGIAHESTLAVARAREHMVVGVDAQGVVDPVRVADAIRSDTELVSIALANGEIGTVQQLREIAQVVRAARDERLRAGDTRPLYLHTDATQAPTTLSVNVSSLGVDMMTLSAAKLYGPKQVGLLWAADGIALKPLVLGGGQENGLRSGTENVAGIVGFARALQIACDERKEEARRLARLRDSLQRGLLAAHPDAVVSGPRKGAQRLPGLLHVSYPGLEARRLVIMLDKRGVSVGTGSACAASKMRISPALTAIGMSDEVAQGSLRITMGRFTTQEQVERAAAIINEVVSAEKERVLK